MISVRTQKSEPTIYCDFVVIASWISQNSVWLTVDPSPRVNNGSEATAAAAASDPNPITNTQTGHSGIRGQPRTRSASSIFLFL